MSEQIKADPNSNFWELYYKAGRDEYKRHLKDHLLKNVAHLLLATILKALMVAVIYAPASLAWFFAIILYESDFEEVILYMQQTGEPFLYEVVQLLGVFFIFLLVVIMVFNPPRTLALQYAERAKSDFLEKNIGLLVGGTTRKSRVSSARDVSKKTDSSRQ